MTDRKSCFDCNSGSYLECCDKERHIWTGFCGITGEKVKTNPRMRPPFWCPWWSKNLEKLWEEKE